MLSCSSSCRLSSPQSRLGLGSRSALGPESFLSPICHVERTGGDSFLENLRSSVAVEAHLEATVAFILSFFLSFFLVSVVILFSHKCIRLSTCVVCQIYRERERGRLQSDNDQPNIQHNGGVQDSHGDGSCDQPPCAGGSWGAGRPDHLHD